MFKNMCFVLIVSISFDKMGYSSRIKKDMFLVPSLEGSLKGYGDDKNIK